MTTRAEIGFLILVLAVVLAAWTGIHKIVVSRREAREAKIEADRVAGDAIRAERRRLAEETILGAERRKVFPK